MNLKNTLIVFNILIFNVLFSQSNIKYSHLLKKNTIYSVKDYPSGIYETYEDFIIKTPSDTIPLRRMKDVGFEYEYVFSDQVEDRVFFFIVKNNSKLKNAFAVSYEGELYIKQEYFSKYAKDGNKNEGGENPNMFHRVIKDGKFFYFEGEFANNWAKGFAYGSGGAVGGVIGSSLNKLKGVIFDVDYREFDFIKNCKDFNLFLEENDLDKKIECDGRNIDIQKVREVIDEIIK